MSQSIAPAHVAHLLPGFVVGTLSPAERRETLAHLTECAVCRAELAAWGAIGKALSDPLPDQPANDATLREVWRRVDAAAQIGRPFHSSRPGNGRMAGPAPAASAPRRRIATGRADEAAPPPAEQTGNAPLAAARPPWPPGRLATAVLLLSMGLVFIAFGLGWRAVGDPVQQLAAPELAPGRGDVAQETLLDVVIPAAYVPVWDRSSIALALITIPPANTSTWETPALRVEYVLAGEYRVRSDGPSMVIRHGAAAPEDVPVGAELVMAPGDTLIAPAESTSDHATDASSGADILNWVVEEEDSSPAKPGSWLEYALDHRHDLRPRSGALSLRVLRIDLGPDAVLAPPDDPLHLFVQADFVESTIAVTSDGSRRNIGKTTATLYSSTVSPFGTGTLMP